MWGFFVNTILLHIFVKINNKDMYDFKFFQQKPLFVTIDGYQIFPNESFISVNKHDMNARGKMLPALTIVERWPVPKRFADKFKVDDTLVYFKHLKNAKKYVSSNKKKYHES